MTGIRIQANSTRSEIRLISLMTTHAHTKLPVFSSNATVQQLTQVIEDAGLLVADVVMGDRLSGEDLGPIDGRT